MNLAGVLPWTYWRFFVIVGLLAVGNVFCMACPFMLPRELGRRLGLATRHWPAPLRSKWLAVVLLALFFWAYEALALWNSPLWTAWIVVAYFVGAFVVDTLFRGASFCKYVCPIGQFQFVSSLVSPFEVRLKDRTSAPRCVTHDCLRGNASAARMRARLCTSRKKPGTWTARSAWTACAPVPMTTSACSLPVLPAAELHRDPLRSSIGRFSRRPDLAALALVLLVGAFAGAAAMVSPFAASVSSSGLRAAAFFAAALAAATALAAAASAAG